MYLIDYQIPKYLIPLSDKLYNLYLDENRESMGNLTDSKTVKIKQSIQCLCHNIVYHLSFGRTSVEVVLNPNAYAQPLIYNAIKVNRKVSYTHTRNIINWLVDTNRVKLSKGGVDNWGLSEDGLFIPKSVTQSYLEVSEELVDMFQEVLGSRRLPTIPSVLEVRDKEGNVITKRLGVYEKEMVILLNQYNLLSRNTTIEVGDTFYDVQLKKVYNNSSFELGGRNYITNALNFRREERKLIKLDGEPTVELDYEALHPRIAATIEGVVLDKDFDPYQIELDGYNPVLARWLGKWATLILLNAGVQLTQRGTYTINSARKALISTLRKRGEVCFNTMTVKIKGKEYKLPQYVDYSEILNKCLERNDYIRLWFYEGRGLTLQNLDSKIMDMIISKFNEMGELIIPVHDSIVVKEELADKAKEIMLGTFKQVLGDNSNCVIK